MKSTFAISIFLLCSMSSIVNASCYLGKIKDQKINVEVEKINTSRYRVKLLAPTYYTVNGNQLIISKVTLVRENPYLEFELAIFPNNKIDEILFQGDGFAPNRKTPNAADLMSYSEFFVGETNEISKYSAIINYGSKECDWYFGSPVQLKYNQALKAQPSGAGDTASGAP